MSTVLIFLGAQTLLTFMLLWSFLAMAHWSDRQLAIAWQRLQESKPKVEAGLDQA